MNNKKREEILNKVQRAMALAMDNPNDSEGQTALAMAQKLMLKHDISMSEVSLETNEKNVVRDRINNGVRLSWWEKELSQIIAKNFRCHYWWAKGRGETKVIYMGLESDVALAKEVYNFAVDSIKFYSKRFIKENDLGGNVSVTRVYKDNYIQGFLSGLSTVFEEQLKEQEEFGLMIVKDALVEKEYSEMKFKKVSYKTPDVKSLFAYEKGYQEGQSTDHNRKRI